MQLNTIKSMLSALVISASLATAAKADTFLTYTVDGTYNNGGGTKANTQPITRAFNEQIIAI